MKKFLWNKLEKLFLINNSSIEVSSIYEKGLKIINPYLISCSKIFQQNARYRSLDIPFEDFYSNSLLYVWKGMEDYIEKQLSDRYTIKNVLIRRIKLSELKTWGMYKKKGTKYDQQKISYASARNYLLTEINEAHFSSNSNVDTNVVVKISVKESLKIMKENNLEGANFIKKLLMGYSSKDAFLETMKGVQKYGSRERKQAERIKKKFISIYDNELGKK